MGGVDRCFSFLLGKVDEFLGFNVGGYCLSVILIL